MTVTVTSIIEGPLTANGVTTTFGFPFKVMSAAELSVYQGAIGDWTLVNDALYSVTLNSGEGGQVVFTAAPAGSPLYIASTPSFEQQGGFAGGEVPFTPVAVGALLDQAAIRALVLKDGVERSLKVPLGEEAPVLGTFADADGKVVGVVAGKMVPVPNGAADFAQAVVEAKAEIGEQVDQVEEAADTVATQAGQVASNTGLAAAAAAQTQADAINTAAALALALDLIVGERKYKQPLIADAVTEGLAAVASGETFAATGDDVVYYGVYKDVAGVATELWKAPKFLMPGAVAPRTVTYPRALVLADALQAEVGNIVTVQFGLPTGMIGDIRVPSNATDPLPLNTTIEYLFLGGNDARFIPDAGVTIVSLVDGDPVLNEPGSIARLRKVATNTWQLYAVRGNLGTEDPAAWTVPYLVHIEPGLCRQEVTQAAATTPANVGDPVGTIILLGSVGGYAYCVSDARRPTLQMDATGRYYLKFNGSAVAGQGNFMRIAGSTLNMATLKWVVGFRSFSTGSSGGSGIVTFGTSGTGTTNRNDGGHFGLNFDKADITYRAGDPGNGGASNPNGAGIYDKRPGVVQFEQPGNGALASLRYERLLLNQNGVANNLTNMTGYILFGCQQGNNADGALQFSEIGLYSFAATDAALTTPQKNALRDYAEARTRAAPPIYSSINDVTARDAARLLLNTELYGGGGALPTDVGTLAAEDRTTIGFASVTGIASWEKMTLPGDYAGVKPRLITPTVTPNGKTVLVWIGHTFQLKDYNVPSAVLPPLLAAGYRVILLAPPGGANDYTAGDPGNHNTNKPALKLWTGAASIAMNTVEDLFPGETFYMCGVSGGGWATVACQASDERIIGATQFVGSYPDFIPMNRDWEQRLPGLTAHYFDLYLLGASNGWQVHTCYDLDTAGFNLAAFNIFGIDWEPTVAAQAAALGGAYEFNMRTNNFHGFEATIFGLDFVSRLPAP